MDAAGIERATVMGVSKVDRSRHCFRNLPRAMLLADTLRRLPKIFGLVRQQGVELATEVKAARLERSGKLSVIKK